MRQAYINWAKLSTLFDVLMWLDLLSGIKRHGRLHKITYLGPGAPIERVLRTYGVPCYGRCETFNDDERLCYVPRRQAIFAEYLLQRAGISLTSRMLGRRTAPGAMPREWGVGVRRPSLVARIARIMGV